MITYRSAHTRVSALWGKASKYPCVECGLAADEWAYDGTDPQQLTHLYKGKYPMHYSTFPGFYMPMCFACHRLRDKGLDGCVNGHLFTEENTIRVSSRPNARRCRACYLETQKRQYQKRKAQKALSLQ